MSNNNGINIILYPREYNKRGHEHLHSVKGMTIDGNEINVKLRIPDKYIAYDHIPRISDLANTDPKAKKYCLSSKNNCLRTREGVLLFSGAIKESDKKSKIDTYVASWVEVLANSSDSPDPMLGFGRIEVNKSSKKINSIQKELAFQIRNCADKETIDSLDQELINPKNYSYSAIYYIVNKACLFGVKDRTRLKEHIIQSVNNFTELGKVGGFMIRAYTSTGRIKKNSYREYFPRHSTISSGINIGKVLFEDKRTELSEILTLPDVVNFEIVPLVKVTTGPKSSEYYGSSERYKKILRTFYNGSEPILCRMISRTTEYIESGTTLLYKAYPLSVSLGHPAKLSKDGVLNILFDHEKDTKGNSTSLLNLEGRKIGMTRNIKVLQRASWMLNEKIPLLIKTNTDSNSALPNKNESTASSSTTNYVEKKPDNLEQEIVQKPDNVGDKLTGMAAFLARKNKNG